MSAIVAIGLTANIVHADRITGTWTGQVDLWGNYYWERSTRVVAPAVGLRLESPDGLRLDAHYLVDAITSASQAAGTLVDRRFTEIRDDVSVGVGREFEIGETPVDLSIYGRLSHEPDYLSLGTGVVGSVFLNQRATTLSLALNYVHDDVGSVLRGANRAGPDGRDLSDRGEVGELNGFVMSAAVEQVLTPEMFVQVGYDLGYLDGYLSNPYRQVSVQGALIPETHPEERLRHTLHGRVAYFVRPTHTGIHLLYRAYVDSWDIGALTPEARIYQEIGPFTTLRLRYRHYRQTRSFFYREPTDYTQEDPFVTADPKMSEFHSDLLGVKLLLTAEFLEGSALDYFRDTSVHLIFEYIFNTNRFGNGVISQLGLSVPF